MRGFLARLGASVFLLLAAAGCTGVDNGMGVDQGADGSQAQFPDLGGDSTEQPATATAMTAANPASVSAEGARVKFAPVVGAPVDRVTPFSQRLKAAAATNAVTLVKSDATEPAHMLKGYFSAFTDSGKTIVVHVFDVIGTDGRRIHRFSGQETVEGQAADPWQIVPDSTMTAIADKVLADYAAWKAQGA